METGKLALVNMKNLKAIVMNYNIFHIPVFWEMFILSRLNLNDLKCLCIELFDNFLLANMKDH